MKCKLLFTLFDEIGANSGLALGNGVMLLAKRYGFHEECHILSESAHSLQTLAVLKCVGGAVAVDHIPVLACYDRHAGDCEILVQSVKGSGASATSG